MSIKIATRHTQKQAGFTLIELLVAMSISAVIAVMSYQAIAEVTQVKTSSEAHAERFASLQRTLWWMEQDFSQMTPRSILDEFGSVLPAYLANDDGNGSAVELSRIAVYPSPYGSSGLVRVGYRVEDEKLMRIIWPVVDRAPDTVSKRFTILDGVTDFSIKQLDENKAWQETWPRLTSEDSRNTTLPSMVKITFTYKGFGAVRKLVLGAYQ